MSVSEESHATLEELALEVNREMETTAQAYSERAFNLGCSIAMLPAAIILVLTFLLSRTNWALTGVVAVLVGLAAVGLALLAASVAKRSAVERVYIQQTTVWLPPRLEEIDANWMDFVETVRKTQQEGSLLRTHIDRQPQQSEQETL